MGNYPPHCQNISKYDHVADITRTSTLSPLVYGNNSTLLVEQNNLTNQTFSYEKISECWIEYRIGDFLRRSLPFIILPISLICNGISFLVLRGRHMRGTSTAFFMLALSLFDPLVLVTKNLVYKNFASSHPFHCKILYFFIYVLNYTTVWILVVMTADKFFAVWFPLKVSYFCTISRAKIVCIIILSLTSLISLHHFWTVTSLSDFDSTTNSTVKYCYYDADKYKQFMKIWRYADFFIWCFIPFILILTLSVLIIYKLRNKKSINIDLKQKRFYTNTFLGSRKLANIRKDIHIRSNQKTEAIRLKHRHITLMLLAVAVVFLLLTLPNSIYFVLDLKYDFNSRPKKNNYAQWLRYRRLTILTIVLFQLSDLQHTMNFFLYILTSNKFRQSVLSIFAVVPICRRKIQQNLQITTTTTVTTQPAYLLSFRSSTSDVSTINHHHQRNDNNHHYYQQMRNLPKKKLIQPISIASATTTSKPEQYKYRALFNNRRYSNSTPSLC
ncbi:unnamed protein product [Didymodactylos carnosus]|uniref:G-protein coupled receptors family 1 profile domain-containing protein n=1 Tax=Didymodactylos carnosus TaxID=1234261 RepID=A0A814DXG9_9BILA|nr:unnamed protein product [Didymodactylos carnosus]CAF0959569.1 unnamed protein product [Didymodactylos carnosus]CAF3579075.1 unnamed protein product [Didymodactylos carnosus]CAF3734301.1 unnamed protein product [Didymodactylos carnosus]